MAGFNTIAPVEFEKNIFSLIAKDWMLITAEHGGKTNAMTAAWGGFGHIWNKYVAYLFIRPQRFTKTLVDAQNNISLCVLGGTYRDTLNYLGTASGRDEDKIKKAGLTVLRDNGTPYFAESETVFLCKKLFAQPFDEASFADKQIVADCYPKKDFHTIYVAEIQKILVRA